MRAGDEVAEELLSRFILQRASATAAVAAVAASWSAVEEVEEAEDAKPVVDSAAALTADATAIMRSGTSWSSQRLHLTGMPSVTMSGVGP